MFEDRGFSGRQIRTGEKIPLRVSQRLAVEPEMAKIAHNLERSSPDYDDIHAVAELDVAVRHTFARFQEVKRIVWTGEEAVNARTAKY